jgi:hypothetical protein
VAGRRAARRDMAGREEWSGGKAREGEQDAGAAHLGPRAWCDGRARQQARWAWEQPDASAVARGASGNRRLAACGEAGAPLNGDSHAPRHSRSPAHHAASTRRGVRRGQALLPLHHHHPTHLHSRVPAMAVSALHLHAPKRWISAWFL